MEQYNPNKDYSNSNITEIEIPEGITSIDNNTFYGCNYLINTVIPDSITKIGNYAFLGCNALTGIIIPDNVKEIGKCAFYWCEALSNIVIPGKVTKIGNSSFFGCSSLNNIEVDPKNTVYCSLNGVLFDKDMKTLICYPAGLKGEYTIPDSVAEIGEAAFSSCKFLSSTAIPYSVTKIGKSAFACCSSLSSIVIPNKITTIGKMAFSECKSLSGIVIPDSVTAIGEAAFNWCSNLKEIIIRGRPKLGRYIFSECHSLKKIYAPNISVSAFDKSEKAAAVCGFAEIKLNGEEIPEKICEEYFQYIKDNLEDLFETAVENEWLLRYMLKEKLILKSHIKQLLRMTVEQGKIPLTAEIMEYTNSLKKSDT